MASEALTNNFTVIFNKQFDAQIAKTKERITKNEAQVKEHQEVHAQILKYLESNKLIAKEAFLKIFPAEGGQNIMTNAGSGVIDPNYTTLVNGFRDEADKDLKKLPDRLYKLANAHSRLASSKTQLQNEEKFKADGAEKLVSLFYSAIIQQTSAGGGVDPFLKKALGTKQNPIEYDEESWEDTVSAITQDIIKFDYIPSGVLTDASLFNLIQEQYFSGELGQKSETKASPINATEAGGEKAKAASPINQPAGESPDKKETSASITETGKVAKEPETESKVVSKTESINEPTPEEKLTEVTPPPGKIEKPTEKKAEANVINIGEKEIAELDKKRKEAESRDTKISKMTQNFNLTEDKRSKVEKILKEFAEKKTSGPSPVNAIAEVQASGKYAQPTPTTTTQSSTINQTSSSESNINQSESLESSSTSEQINEFGGNTATSTSTSTTGSTTTSTNKVPVILNDKQKDIINEYKQKMGVSTQKEKEEAKKIREDLEKNIKITSIPPPKEGGAAMSVEKGKVSFEEKIPSNTQTSFATTNNTQNLSQPIASSESSPTQMQAMNASNKMESTAQPQTPQSQPGTTIDMSAVEKRLKNLEELLSSPLSVRLV